jgi:transcription initiation factor TFIIB
MNDEKSSSIDVYTEQTTEDKCPDCGSKKIYKDPTRGEVICGDCGIVISERSIEQGPEWRAFSSEEREARSRVGAPITMAIHDKGLSTVIDKGTTDAYGQQLAPSRRAQIYRLRKLHIRSLVHDSNQRNLAEAMSRLDLLTSQLGISRDTKETAAILYRKALDERAIRGRSIHGVVATSVYLACRVHKIPRTLEEISKYSTVTSKELGRTVRIMLRLPGISVPRPKPQDYVTRLGNDSNISMDVQQLAREILDQAEKKGIITGKDPIGLAAAALYTAGLSLGKRITQKDIAYAARVTEVTVRSRYKELVKKLELGRKTLESKYLL